MGLIFVVREVFGFVSLDIFMDILLDGSINLTNRTNDRKCNTLEFVAFGFVSILIAIDLVFIYGLISNGLVSCSIIDFGHVLDEVFVGYFSNEQYA